MQIIDTAGKWYRNMCMFPFTDPESGVRFEPEELYKVNETAWLKGQAGVIVEMPDPETPLTPLEPEVPLVPEIPLAPEKTKK